MYTVKGFANATCNNDGVMECWNNNEENNGIMYFHPSQRKCSPVSWSLSQPSAPHYTHERRSVAPQLGETPAWRGGRASECPGSSHEYRVRAVSWSHKSAAMVISLEVWRVLSVELRNWAR